MGTTRESRTSRRPSRTQIPALTCGALIGLFASTVLMGAATSKAADVAEPQYLAFQVFTGALNPHVGLGAEPVLREIPSMQTLDAFARDIATRIGTTSSPAGTKNRKLALIFGPLAFDQTDAQIKQMIADTFQIALKNNVAVGFHIDDSMFWGRRTDLIADPKNIERAGWENTPALARRLDWGPSPTRIPPPMCINSAAIKREVVNRAHVIGTAIHAGILKLRAAGREDLFAAVLAGWETQIGRDFPDNRPLGYCALANRGVKPGASSEELFNGRVAAVADFISLWAEALASGGVPENKIYSHVAFATKTSTEPRSNFAPPSVAFGPHRHAGFSTYPAPGIIEELGTTVRDHGGDPWASSEGANVLLAFGAMDSGMSMETYLARLFNRGAMLVNVFGWGLGDENYPFRKAAENQTAIEAYRKFLKGDALIEGPVAPTILDRLPKKIARIQAELPPWAKRHPERIPEVKRLTDALEAAMATQNPLAVERAADAIVSLIDGK